MESAAEKGARSRERRCAFSAVSIRFRSTAAEPPARPAVRGAAQVLLLNKVYAPLKVIGLRECVSLLVREAADVLDVHRDSWSQHSFCEWCRVSERGAGDDDDWIRTVSLRIRVPRLIRLRHYDRVFRQEVKLSRRAVFLRDDYRCAYCGGRFSAGRLSLDHVLPRSRGGRTAWANLVTACKPCNVKKGQRTPEQAGLRLRAEPRKPRFHPAIDIAIQEERYAIWRMFLPRSRAGARPPRS